MKWFPASSFGRKNLRRHMTGLGVVCCVGLSFGYSLHAHAETTETTAAVPAVPPASASSATAKPEDPLNRALEDYSLWAGLVFASNQPAAPEQVGTATRKDEIFKNLKIRLGKAFKNYSTFDLLGVDYVPVFRAYESWAVLSQDKYFNLKFDSKGMDEKGGLKLHMQLWQDKKVLVKADAVLRKEQPLFIAGPKWREGQLMFVVMLNNNHP